ncbi:MAG TPA: GntR family transcriptional regulator [Devosia sp.]|nr:GntR family transcriptional regulator [Devosia sp.]
MRPVSVRVSKTTFIDGAYQAILNAILSREFKPGDRLRSKEIAVRLSISRTPVERALERLAGEGLVEFRPGDGPYVMEPTVRNVLELYDLRLTLELYASSIAVQRPDPAFLAEFNEKQRAFKLVSGRLGDSFEAYLTVFDADKAVHQHLFSACIGTQARDFYSQISTRIMIAQFAAFGPFFRGDAVAEHMQIYRAFQKWDAAAVEHAVTAHIEAARSAFIDRAQKHGLEVPTIRTGLTRQDRASAR